MSRANELRNHRRDTWVIVISNTVARIIEDELHPFHRRGQITSNRDRRDRIEAGGQHEGFNAV